MMSVESFYKENPCEKLKKEVIRLLMKPDLMDGSDKVILTREQMANYRVSNLSDVLYQKIKKNHAAELKEARLTKSKFKKAVNCTLKDLITIGTDLMTPEEKQKIYDSQEERLEEIMINGVPMFMLLDEEQIKQAPNHASCAIVEELLTMTPEEFLQKYPRLLQGGKTTRQVKQKRKPSARNLFIGQMMREKKSSMKEASDLWKNMSEEEREAFND